LNRVYVFIFPTPASHYIRYIQLVCNKRYHMTTNCCDLNNQEFSIYPFYELWTTYFTNNNTLLIHFEIYRFLQIK
jgi:hypothetical protein